MYHYKNSSDSTKSTTVVIGKLITRHARGIMGASLILLNALVDDYSVFGSVL